MNRGMKQTLVMCLVIGLVLAALGLIMGGKTSLSVGWKGVHVPSGKTETLSVDEQLEFDELVIDVSTADVTVTQGDRFSLRAEYRGGTKPSYSLSGGVLRIEDDGARGIQFSLGFFTYSNRVEVTLPKGTLVRADIRSQVGDMKLSALSCSTLAVNTGTGEIALRGVTCDEITGDAGVGDVILESVNAKRVGMHAGTGSITGKRLAFEDGEFDCGVGDGELNDISSGKLYLHSGTGSVYAKGELRGESRLTSGVGDVEVKTSLPRSDYRVDADAGLGDVNLTPEGDQGSQNAPHTLIMESGVGSVSAEFGR